MKLGRFITFEGVDGSGKSTQARLLAEHLRADGREVVLTREPGGAPGAELLRTLLLDNTVSWAPLAETFLMFAARAEHVEKTIRPALQRGAWVISDRFTDSTIAYQGAGRAVSDGVGEGVDLTIIHALIGMIDLCPDLTIILDVGDDTRRERLKIRQQRADHYEQRPDLFYQHVRDTMRRCADTDPKRYTLISGDQSVDDVSEAIRAALLKL
jgi:dTMP kinase